MVRDVLQHAADAAGNQIKSLGAPSEKGDATFTDTQTAPAPIAGAGAPGRSLLAAPADHVHPDPAPMRVVASGTTTLAAGARVTLSTFRRGPGEMFPPGGFVFVRDDKDGITWENEVDGANHLGTYHERTGKVNELRFRAVNVTTSARTIEWATAGLTTPPV